MNEFPEPRLRYCRVCEAVLIRARHAKTKRRIYLEPVPAGSGDYNLTRDRDSMELTVAVPTTRGYYMQHDARCSDPVRFAGLTRPTRRRRRRDPGVKP